MIVPLDEIRAIQRYGCGVVVVSGDPPPIESTHWVRPSVRSRSVCEVRVSDSYSVTDGHELLLEKVTYKFDKPVARAVRERRRASGRSSELRLSREQRAAVLAKKPATELVFEQEPEVEEGDSYVVVWSRPQPIVVRDDQDRIVGVFHPDPEPLVTVKVTSKVRRAKGGWKVAINVTDRRDPSRFPRRVPPALEPEVMKADRQKATGPEKDDIKAATEEGAYTTSPVGAVDDRESPGKDALDDITDRAHMLGHQENARRRLDFEQQTLIERIENAIVERERLGLDDRRDIARLEAGIAKIERRNALARQQKSRAA